MPLNNPNAHVVPWPQETYLLEHLREAEGGSLIIAAACIDYAYLSDLAPLANAASMSGGTEISREARIDRGEEYDRLLHSSEYEDRVNAVLQAAQSLAEDIPASEREAVLFEAEHFLASTAGHTAVLRLANTLEALTP